MYFIYKTIGLCILQYDKRTLLYTLRSDTLSQLINRFQAHSKEPFRYNYRLQIRKPIQSLTKENIKVQNTNFSS